MIVPLLLLTAAAGWLLLPHMRTLSALCSMKKSSMSNDINIRAYRIFNSFLYIAMANDVVCVYLV